MRNSGRKILFGMLILMLMLLPAFAVAATHTVTDASKMKSTIEGAKEGDTIVLEVSYNNWQAIQARESITIQLNGNSINRTLGGAAVDVTDGNVTIVGPGKISGATTGVLVADDAALVLDGGVEVEGRDGHGVDNDGKLTINNADIAGTEYGIALYEGSVEMNTGSVSGAYGIAAYTDTKVTINGGAVNGTVAGLSGHGQYHGTEFEITGGTIQSERGVGIYHPQNGKLTISGGTIIGATGINMKSGEANISGGVIAGTGAASDYGFVASGFNPTGDALVVESCNYPGGAPQVAITGGHFDSKNADAVASYAGNNATDVVDGFISGGSFSNDPNPALIVAGEETVKIGDRWYLGAAVPAPVASASTAPKTGDNSNLMLWASLMLLAGIGMVVVGKKRLSADR